MILYVAIYTSDGHVIHVTNHQSRTIVYILPVIIITAGSAIAGGLAEVVELPFQNNVLIGSYGSDQLVHGFHVDLQLRLGRLNGCCGVHLIKNSLGKGIALCIGSQISIAVVPGTDAVALKAVVFQNHVLSCDIKSAASDPVTHKQVVPEGSLSTGRNHKVAQSTDREFTVVDCDILGICHLEEGISAIFFQTDIVNTAIGYRHIAAGVKVHCAAGTFIDLTAGQRNIRAKMCCQTDYTAAIQAQILHGGIGTALQIQNTAAAFAPFPGMSSRKAFQSHIGTVLNTDHICPTGVCFDNGGQAAIAPDSEVLNAADHEFTTVVTALPGTVIILRILTVGFCFAKIVCTGFQDNLPIGTDGRDQLIYIFNGYRLHSINRNGCFTTLFSRRSHQADSHENNGNHTCQADPEAGLLVFQHRFDSMLYGYLTEGDGTSCEMHFIRRTIQQSCGIFLPLLQLHELNHPLITSKLNILTQKNVRTPDERIEPVQRKSDETDHLEPVVTLFQVCPFMGQNILSDHCGQPHGNIDLGTDKAQNKRSFNPVTFPAAFDFNRFSDLEA